MSYRFSIESKKYILRVQASLEFLLGRLYYADTAATVDMEPMATTAVTVTTAGSAATASMKATAATAAMAATAF